MISFSENIDANERVILRYLVSTDNEYRLYNENNETISREKVLKLLHPSFFFNEAISEICRVMHGFYDDYNKIPNIDEIWQVLKIRNSNIVKEELNLIFAIDLSRFTHDFVFAYLKTFVMMGNLNMTLNGVVSYLKTIEIKTTNMDEVFDFVRNEISGKLAVEMTCENQGLSIYDPKSHIQPTKAKRSTGFAFFDKVLGGGWEPKTLIVMAGRPKIGKSLVLSNMAVRSARSGANVGVFTVELADRKYVKRIGANLLNIPYTLYSKFLDENDLGPVTEAIAKFKKSCPSAGELMIKEYPTGGANAIDIENYFLALERTMKIHFDVLFVDYLNLLKPTGKADATMYEKIKKIAEELRRIAQRNNWCIVSATQVKAQYFNSDELFLDSAAESSGLIATVDSFFGITGEPGAAIIKIKNIANRDEGHMDSYKTYVKEKMYFRLVEDTAPGSEFWSEEDGEDLQRMMIDEYRKLTNPDAMTKRIEAAVSVEMKPVIPDPVSEASKDFDINAKIAVATQSKMPVQNVSAINVDYDEILKNL